MLKNHVIKWVVILAGGMISSSGFANSKVSECSSRPDFLGQVRSSAIRSIDQLPQMVFVGRKAEFYIEDKLQNLKIHSRQSFTRAESKVLCASAALAKNEKSVYGFSMYAPTLIDLSGDKKTGDSYWQFHLSAEADKIGVWNKRSRVFSGNKDLEAGLQKIGAKYQFVQISHDEYELILIKETANTIQALSIRFDAVRDLK